MISPGTIARIAVVGTTGAGKTTLARAISAHLDVPHIELDDLYWGPNWTPRPADVFRAEVDECTAQPGWVCDGNYNSVRDVVWRRANVIVWLNYSFPTIFSRVVRRTIHRVVNRTRLFAGNRESLAVFLFSRDSLLLWIMKTHWRRQREFPVLLNQPEFAHLRMVELRSPAGAKRFLAELAVKTGNQTTLNRELA